MVVYKMRARGISIFGLLSNPTKSESNCEKWHPNLTTGKTLSFDRVLLTRCINEILTQQNVVGNLRKHVFFNCSDQAIRQWGNPTTRTASEMELYSFERANTKVNY